MRAHPGATAHSSGKRPPAEVEQPSNGDTDGIEAPAPTSAANPSQTKGGPEPLVLELEGWPPSTDTTDGDHRLLVYDGKEGDCRIAVDRWWGQPPRPGGPMMIASRKAIAIDGREFELLETSAFDGVERVVQVVFHGNDAFQVRVVFAECAPATVAKALDLIRILR